MKFVGLVAILEFIEHPLKEICSKFKAVAIITPMADYSLRGCSEKEHPLRFSILWNTLQGNSMACAAAAFSEHRTEPPCNAR